MMAGYYTTFVCCTSRNHDRDIRFSGPGLFVTTHLAYTGVSLTGQYLGVCAFLASALSWRLRFLGVCAFFVRMSFVHVMISSQYHASRGNPFRKMCTCIVSGLCPHLWVVEHHHDGRDATSHSPTIKQTNCLQLAHIVNSADTLYVTTCHACPCPPTVLVHPPCLSIHRAFHVASQSSHIAPLFSKSHKIWI